MTTAGAAAFTYDGLDRVYQRVEGAVTSTFGYAGQESDPISDGTNTHSRAAGRLLVQHGEVDGVGIEQRLDDGQVGRWPSVVSCKRPFKRF